MPRGRSYGDKLRIARERAGFDVVTMAKRLHIRPDILKAIENADFERMPARGYTRNMIRAYARQVGVDEREVSEMYLDEVHMHETGTPRLSRSSHDGYGRDRRIPSGYDDRPRRPPTRFDDYDDRERGRAREGYADRYEDRPSRDIVQPVGRGYGRSAMRQSIPFNDEPPSRDRRGYPDPDDRYSGRSRSRSDSRSIRFASSPSRRFDDGRGYSERFDRAEREGGDGARGRSPRDARSRSIRFNSANASGSGGRRRPITLTQSSHSYADLYPSNGSKPKMPDLNMPLLIIIGVVAIAVIIAVVVLFNSTTQSVEDIPDIPIAGYSDTSDPEDEIAPIAALAEPTFAQFTYEVEAGEKSWIEIYENGRGDPIFAGIVTGPATETYEVTGTLTFEAANPTPVTIMVDGEKVDLVKSPTSGYYTYTVDFASVLAAWREENELYTSGAATDAAAGSSSNTNATNASRNAANSSNPSVNRSTNGSASSTSTNRNANSR